MRDLKGLWRFPGDFLQTFLMVRCHLCDSCQLYWELEVPPTLLARTDEVDRVSGCALMRDTRAMRRPTSWHSSSNSKRKRFTVRRRAAADALI